MALSADKITSRRDGKHGVAGMAADAVTFLGSLVVLDASGFLDVGTLTTGLTAVGIATEAKDNTGGANGALTCTYEAGVFGFKNNGTNTIDATDIGALAYIEDDEEVGNLATGRSAAGRIMDYDAASDTVYVKVGATVA